MIVSKEYAIAAAEINTILRYTAETDVYKIPASLRSFFREVAMPNYIPNINPTVNLENQELTDKTKALLAMLYCYYWCSEEELEKIKLEIKSEAMEVKEELSKQYNVEQFFKGERKREVPKELSYLPVDVQTMPWYVKIGQKLKGWFMKFGK